MADHDATGCCTDADVLEQVTIDNPAGLPALRRRIGTHGSFLARLKAGLSRHEATRGLTTREADDFAMALFDGWAAVADNLTFYTERIANEHYLGTARERRSLTEMARLIGRTLQPGLAAEVDLAFSMDRTAGAPKRLELAAGTAVQSDPEPGADPAVFETIETREIRPAWNRLRARTTTSPKWIDSEATSVHLAGTATQVEVGALVVYRNRFWAPVVARVTAVETVDEVVPSPVDPGRPGSTELHVIPLSVLAADVDFDDLGAPTAVPGLTGVAAWLDGRTLTAAELDAEAAERRVDLADVEASVSGRHRVEGRVHAFRLTAGLFGSSAPQSSSLATALKDELLAIDDSDLTREVNQHVSSDLFPWDSADAADMPGNTTGQRVLLDAEHKTITGPSLAVLSNATSAAIYEVETASVGSFADDGVSGKTTRLDLNTSSGLASFELRDTTVHARSVELVRAPVPDDTPVTSTTVELESLAIGLVAGRSVVVSGQAVDDPGRTVSHLTSLSEVTHRFGDDRTTTLTLSTALPEPLLRSTVTVNANVVRGSHGMTRSDVLGSGDGRRSFQSFELADRPLTYLSAVTQSGRTSTLRVFVDDVEWSEVDQLVESGPTDRVFVSRETETGTVVQFGDGRTGARLPTGVANVRAAYRVGAGAAGRVAADRLTILASRPPGLSGVTNPAASEGGAEPETADRARQSVAVNVRTLGRVVSLRDYEDYARSFSGVSKAMAVWGRSGRRRGIVVTVAGDDGDAIPPGSPIHDSLVDSYAEYGDELVPVHLVDHRPRVFRVAADVRAAAGYQPDLVHAAVDEALQEAFAFDRRALGASVYASEILEVIHRVTGVVAADLTLFGIVTDAGVASTVPDRLDAQAPTAGGLLADAIGAELLTIEPHPVSIGGLP